MEELLGITSGGECRGSCSVDTVTLEIVPSAGGQISTVIVVDKNSNKVVLVLLWWECEMCESEFPNDVTAVSHLRHTHSIQRLAIGSSEESLPCTEW